MSTADHSTMSNRQLAELAFRQAEHHFLSDPTRTSIRLQEAQTYLTLELLNQLEALNEKIEFLRLRSLGQVRGEPRPANTPELYESLSEPLDEIQRIQGEIMRENDEAMKR